MNYLEQMRTTLSSIEVVEKTVVYCLFGRKNVPHQAVLLDHRINNLLLLCQKQAAEAQQLIEGTDGWKKEELDFLQGHNRKDGDVWESFYERYKEIKDQHRKSSQAQPPQTNKVEYFFDQAFEPPFKEPFFSGEEGNGRYLDLHANYNEFLNLKKLRQSEEYKMGDYLWYLQNFDLFHEIPQSLKEKAGSKYRKYLTNLYEYLRGFYQRVNPLNDFKRVEDSFELDFQRQWRSGVVRGWRINTSEDILSNDLYCQACTKLFQNENTYVHHFNGKKHKTLAKQKEKELQTALNQEPQNEEQLDTSLVSRKKLAHLEFLIQSYKENMTQTITDTMNLVRKKQSKGYDEAGEVEGPVDDHADQVSEEEEPIYNPKNLPLGWDGRPIPYWLYKLHGLGVEYKCEICGNTSYWGRKAFEDHFQGWRHSYGMRCLRIPNTLHFKEITKISDAIQLHQRIQQLTEQNKFRPDYEEEYEDAEGNLLNKKTYYDLRKQGLA